MFYFTKYYEMQMYVYDSLKIFRHFKNVVVNFIFAIVKVFF